MKSSPVVALCAPGTVLAIALVSMDLQARGQSVSRWDGTSR